MVESLLLAFVSNKKLFVVWPQRKIIGAKFYNADGNFTGEEKSPRDTNGHGTHTASILAGREVEDVSFLGIAKGTVRGAVPSARIVVYKVCFQQECLDHDILAGFDDAIADGVDIISISLAPFRQPVTFSEDSIAIGAFHAMQRGILVSACPGKYGPHLKTLRNDAPWILTTGASTIDRQIISKGLGVNDFVTTSTLTPLIFGGNATISTVDDGSRCVLGSLDKKLVEGKIVLCGELGDARGPLEAGAQGTVMATNITQDDAGGYPLPTTVISNIPDLLRIALYLRTTRETDTNYRNSNHPLDFLGFCHLTENIAREVNDVNFQVPTMKRPYSEAFCPRAFSGQHNNQLLHHHIERVADSSENVRGSSVLQTCKDIIAAFDNLRKADKALCNRWAYADRKQ
ncbi:hypothetical protein IFM89_026643 [Coptis chinensis]|uniref:Peptidase S8/S53 domain-containing protein n=1 Tax=Coptis chinensis TaxID=261450 RepID=A0A835GZ90_9MAGN|nr:hypothetical protein IFM89_026643 [Coptis chinensis]